MEGTPFGRYRLLDSLGRGGMGEVWRAFDTSTDRVVALKALPAQFADDATYQLRFRREAKAAAGLNEPHVVPIYDYGEIDGRLFVTMRLVEGEDLETLIARGRLTPVRAVSIVEQVASALDAAHRIGLVHRDVKPSNVLIGDDDFAYLIDFGIARVAGEAALTSVGVVIGTWAYMAPERFGTRPADARADVYALTCVLYEALTGQPPFPGASIQQIVTAHVLKPPPRPSAECEGVLPAMDAVIATGMAKVADDRYATCKEMASAARAALTDHDHESSTHLDAPEHTGPAVPPSPPGGGASAGGATELALLHDSEQRAPADPIPRRPRKPRSLWIGVGALAIVVAVLAVITLNGYADSETASTAVATSTTPASVLSSMQSSASAARESDRQKAAVRDAVKPACDALSSTSDASVDAVNLYVDAYNKDEPDASTKSGPALAALNKSADAVSGSLSSQLPVDLANALKGWVDAARQLVVALTRFAGPDDFNTAIRRLNDAKTRDCGFNGVSGLTR